MDGSEYAFATCSFGLFAFVHPVEIVQSFSPLFLFPLRTGGALVVIFRVPGSCIVAPSVPGWNMVVYPFSTILFMLIKDHLRPGVISASLALGTIWLNCRVALPDNLSFESFGRNTSIRDGPVFGKFRPSLTKCDVAQESIIIVCLHCFFFSCCRSILLVHLFVLCCVGSTVGFTPAMLISSSSFSLLLSSSGAQ